MKDFREEIRVIEHDAESMYDNFSGDAYPDEEGDDDFAFGFEGNEDAHASDNYYGPDDGEYDDEYEFIETMEPADYDSYNASSIGRIDPNDRTLTIVVKNNGASDQTVYLFAGNRELAQHGDVEVNVEESSHKEVQNESMSNPFTINGLKLSVSDPLQLDQVLHIMHRSATGSNTARVYQPRNATSPQNLNPNMIDDATFSMEVSGQDGISFTQRAGVTSVFTFTISARANMRNVLKGQNVAEMSTAPRPTGLPQMDASIRKPAPFGLRSQTPVRKVVRRSPSRGYGRSSSGRSGGRSDRFQRFMRRSKR